MKRVAIVGGGILGVSTAYTLGQRRPSWKLSLIEKEPGLAAHQTGRNSGVIHSGIYYPPGSLKAHTCLRGRHMLETFCRVHQISHRRCGKLIVATRLHQISALDSLESRGRGHGLTVQRLLPAQIRRYEPACAGLAAIQVAETGVIDYQAVVQKLAELCQGQGVSLLLGERFLNHQEVGPEIYLHTSQRTLVVDGWINCAGLYADRVATSPLQIVPFRGEYYQLRESARNLCQSLIYPVPDARFPFLGVHLTRHWDHTVGAGPNAVLALGRENYDGRSICWSEAKETLTYSGFQQLARRYWKMGLWEQLRSWFKPLFLRSLQELTPALKLDDLLPATSGIRAQAVDPKGTLLDDFSFQVGPRAVHVINAPSPAATACLAIAETVVERFLTQVK